METVEILISVTADLHDFLVAELLDLPVEGFENQDENLKIFLKAENWSGIEQKLVRDALTHLGLSPTWQERRIAEQNWNEVWERSVQPLWVDPFYIRATWQACQTGIKNCIELVIDPRMSFGTGHHESTRLALRLLSDNRDRLTNVLDAGTGTGILAIAAAKLGAASVLGFDVDTWSYENAGENIRLNDVCSMIELRLGSIDCVDARGYTLILANINRNVLLNDLPAYVARSSDDGVIIVSGLQLGDREIMLRAIRENNLDVLQERTEADWWSAAAIRRPAF